MITTISEDQISYIPHYNVRSEFNALTDEADAALVKSMTEKGFHPDRPITVKRHDEGYHLINGYRRLEAARRAGIRLVPAIVED